MEEVLKSLLLETNGVVAYATVFGILLACGLGVPLPEDISLILGGYLAHAGAATLWGMMVTGYLGIIVGDSMIFAAGRRIGRRVGAKPNGFFARIVTPEKRAKVEALFAKHGSKVVMIARFLPGVRAVTYFTAGSVGMKYSRFIFFDSVAALASAPIFVWLGWRFGGELDMLIDRLKQGQITVFAGLGALIAAYLGFKFWKRRRDAAKERAQLAASANVVDVSAQLPAAMQMDSAGSSAPVTPSSSASSTRARA